MCSFYVLTCATVGPTSSSVCSAPFSKAALNSEAGGGGVAASNGGDCDFDAAALLPRLLAAAGAAVEVALALLPPEGAAVGLSAACGVGAAGACCPLVAAVGDAPSAVTSTAIIRQSEEALRRLRPDTMVPLSEGGCHSAGVQRGRFNVRVPVHATLRICMCDATRSEIYMVLAWAHSGCSCPPAS